MTENIRALNAYGISRFGQYLTELRGGSTASPPFALLTGDTTSFEMHRAATIERLSFSNRFEFGQYLVSALDGFDRRAISREHGLWTWLALYFFEALCPADVNGRRKTFADAAYVLPSKYSFRTYYRHLVRTPWMAVADHQEYAKVLLIPAGNTADAPLGVRGEIVEQIASRQSVLGNRSIIKAVYDLYFDTVREKPRRGSGGSSGGSPRRLAIILQQLDLTFDLPACPPEKIVELLPREFARWNAR